MSSTPEDLQECRQTETRVETPANNGLAADPTRTLRNHRSGRAEKVSFVQNTSAIGRLNSRAPALTQSDKEVYGHGDADGDHNATDLLRIDFLHVVRTEPAPDEGTRDHHGALRPQHGASQNEGDYCSGVDHGGKQRPDRTHGVNVTHPQCR